jgi:AraC-like DNA-binding protein
MLSFTELATGQGFAISAVTCRDDHRGWSEPEAPGSFRMVLVRRGRFRRRVRSEVADLDRTVGYLGVPDEEEHFAHPSGGDVCTSVTVCPARWHTIVGERITLPRSTVYLDARLDLAHRRLLSTARAGDIDFALAERLLGLLSAALGQLAAGPVPATGGSSAADAALVAAARAAIVEDHPAASGLFPLAKLLGASPYRLSRAFSRALGVSLTRYRNRVRVGRALDRLEQGAPSLAGLAADLGFADQAHLTRTISEHLGHTPTTVRRLLTS